jgi:outer membrane protein assembly factor BamE (lipoprotein component of BamABCDE complex)
MKSKNLKLNSGKLNGGTRFGLITMAAFLVGCASLSGAEFKDNLAKLKYGMNQSQVLSTLGAPDSVIQTSAKEDRWIYEFKSRDKKGRNLFVDFNQGELSKTGELNGRELAASETSRQPGVCTRRYHPEIMQEAPCLK